MFHIVSNSSALVEDQRTTTSPSFENYCVGAHCHQMIIIMFPRVANYYICRSLNAAKMILLHEA